MYFLQLSLDAFRPEAKVLEESDIKRGFQDYVDTLESAHRQQKRAKKEALQSIYLVEIKYPCFRSCVISAFLLAGKVDGLLKQLKSHFVTLAREGVVLPDSRWKDLSVLPAIQDFEPFKEVTKVFLDSEAETLGGFSLNDCNASTYFIGLICRLIDLL